MPARTEEARLVEVPGALARLLDAEPRTISSARSRAIHADLVVEAGGQTFVVEWRSSASASPVAAAVKQVAQYAERLGRRVIPLVAVPFMGDAGRRVCEEAEVAWLDLSGNAHIVAPGLRVIVDGRPNRFRRRGRPSSVFAPKSARVVRWLLIHPDRAFAQNELARATGVTEGLVSQLVARLLQEGYVLRLGRRVRVKEPGPLLDAWREAYDFSRHTLIQGHIPVRSGDALARFVSRTLVAEDVEHAATGLAAAWQMTHFAGFRVATFFLRDTPSAALMEKLGFHEEPRGANLWLVVPNDDGVFHAAGTYDGVRCVHPVQAFLDLKAHPERAAEAAERLRTELLSGRRHA